MNLPPGFTSRPATPDDLDAVAALIEAWELAHFGEAEADRSMLQFEWAAAWFDVERDTRIIGTADGELAAYADHATPDNGKRFQTFGPVHPRFEGRGLGTAILGWSETQTRARIEPGSETRLWNSVPAADAGATRLLEAHGYVPIRTFWQMTIDLDPSFDAGPLPDGVTIRRFGAEVDGPAAFAVVDAAFATHFGYCEETFEDWWAQQQADETWDPSLGLVAERDGDDRRLQQQRRDRWDGTRVRARRPSAAPGTGDRQGVAPAFLRELRRSRDPHGTPGRGHGERHRRARAVSIGGDGAPCGSTSSSRSASSPARLLTPAERGPT